MNFLFGSVATAKEAILKRWQRKIAPTRTELQATMECDPELPPHIFHDALKEQCDDDDQESPSKNRKLDLDSSESTSSNGFLFTEPPKHDADDICSSSSDRERSRKRPMQRNDSGDDDDDDQETPHKKRRLDQSEDVEITVDSGSSANPLPEEVRMKIMQRARKESEKNVKVVLVIEKVLQKSDLLRSQNRITIPRNQMQSTFLTGEEIRHLRKTGSGWRTNHLAVPVIEPSGEVVTLALRRWNVGKNSVSYVFNGDWKDVVRVNQLRQGQTAQVWAFRVKGQLNFAFVFLPN